MIPWHTYRRFAVAADMITITSTAALEGLTQWSVVALIRPTAIVGGRAIFAKGLASGNNRRVVVATGTTSALRVDADAATTDMQYISENVLRTFDWQWVAVTVDYNASAGDRARFYWADFAGGPFRRLALTATTEPSGAIQSDTGAAAAIGNLSNTAAVFNGDVAGLALSTLRLEPSELHMFALSGTLRGIQGRWYPGLGGATVFDWSGNGNHGAPSSALSYGAAA